MRIPDPDPESQNPADSCRCGSESTSLPKARRAYYTVVQLWWTLDIQYILLSKLKLRKLKAMLVLDLFTTKCFRVPDLFAAKGFRVPDLFAKNGFRVPDLFATKGFRVRVPEGGGGQKGLRSGSFL